MAKLKKNQKGFTLIEMIVTFTILAILAAVAIPLAKTAVKREKEIELRRSLRTIRDAIDAYKKLADENRIKFEDNTEGYPPDLETLVKGVEVSGSAQPGGTQQGRKQPAQKLKNKLIAASATTSPAKPQPNRGSPRTSKARLLSPKKVAPSPCAKR